MIKKISDNRREAVIIFFIFLISAFLRFYRLDEYMNFLGDEGRDALMVKRILVDHDFPLLGPPSSVGNVYLGPLYYYMMALAMSLWFSPVAATAMVASIGVATVLLVYYLAKKWFGLSAAILSSVLYAISPVNIIYSRSSWNPDPAPFFALLGFLGFYKARENKDFRWVILTGLAVASAIQMHYLAMILLPIFILLWSYDLLLKIKGAGYRYFILGTTLGVISFFLLMSPLLIFDFKYNFLNFRALSTIFGGGDTAVQFSVFNTIFSIAPTYFGKFIGRYLGGENIIISIVFGILILTPFIFVLKKGSRRIGWPYLALGLWLGLGLIGMSFYRQKVYDHYLGFVNPAPFLLLGGLINLIKTNWQIASAGLLLMIAGFFNLINNPLLNPPNRQLDRTQKVARFIISEARSKPYNFTLLAKNNYDAAYQFYLDQYGHKPEVVPVNITNQFFVVCEDQVCNPINNPKYEIAAYGWAKIEREYIAEGLKIYKLTNNPTGK